MSTLALAIELAAKTYGDALGKDGVPATRRCGHGLSPLSRACGRRPHRAGPTRARTPWRTSARHGTAREWTSAHGARTWPMSSGRKRHGGDKRLLTRGV